MKKLLICIMPILFLLSMQKCCSQAFEIEQLILNYQKLEELEKILDNMYQGYKILDKGYTTIKNIAEGNYTIQQLFFDGLMAVNPAVRNYQRIPWIISYQQMLLSEYSRAYNRFMANPNFTPEELQYLGNVYSSLFDSSVKNIDDLIMIITATKLSMTDDERLRAIDRVYYDMQSKLFFVRGFNSRAQLLAIQRARAAQEVRTINALYGVN